MSQSNSAGGPHGVSVCSYCGLPLVRSGWWSSKKPALSQGPQFCCLGCQLAADLSSEYRDAPAVRGTILRLGVAIFFAMNATVFTMALWTPDFYGAQGGSRLAAVLDDLFRYGALLTSLPVAVLLGVPLAGTAWAQVRRGLWGTDLLLVLGVAAAYVYSAVSVFRGAGHVYFEVGTVTLVMVTLGRWLEATGKLKTTAALDALDKLLPDRIRRVSGATTEWVAADSVVVGDQVRVLPGERVPLDGRIVRGRAALDEQVLTGESAPVLKGTQELVYGGTFNLDGDLWLEVVAPQGAGTLARLIELVRTARLTKGRYEQQADRVAAWFMPVVALLALAAGAWHAHARGLDQGLMTGLAVVLIACPCALGLATPMAVWSALGQAAQWQVLFRNGLALERLASVRALRFDKTGTLTTGQPRVTEIWFAADDHDTGATADDVLAEAAWLASASTHPFSQAVARLCQPPLTSDAGFDRADYQVRSLAGKGTLATAGRGDALDGPVVGAGVAAARPAERWLGSLAWLAEEGLQLPAAWQRRAVNLAASDTGDSSLAPSENAGEHLGPIPEPLASGVLTTFAADARKSNDAYSESICGVVMTKQTTQIWQNPEGTEAFRRGRRRTSSADRSLDTRSESLLAPSENPLVRRRDGFWDRPLAPISENELHARPSVAWGAEGRVRAIFWIEETVRSEAAEMLAWCQAQGIDVAVLTGDRAERAAVLAQQLAVPVESGLLPEDKLAAVRRARQQFGAVAMVGDGINDAPALAAADVGIALGCGADVSRESAQVCLLGNDLRRLPQAMSLARQTVRVVRQNLVWAFGYNIVGIALAACGWMNPVAAACLMTVSSLLVITNSLRLSGQVAAEGAAELDARAGAPSVAENESAIRAVAVDRSASESDALSPAELLALSSAEAFRLAGSATSSGSLP